MHSLSDIVAPDLRVMLVAINPATESAERGAPFSTATNPFWRLLHEAGLTRRLYLPTESDRILDDGVGLASFVDRPTRAASELRSAELREGAQRLERNVERWRPRLVALLGLTLYPYVFPAKDEPGPGLKHALFAGTRVFVLPNPSGRNRAYPGFQKKLTWYRELAAVCDPL